MTAVTPPQPGPRLPIGGTSLQSRIAEAAIELFYNRGAPATSVRDITAACGLTSGALYNHFSSKEQLLYVLIRDIHLLADQGLEAAIADAGTQPSARLAAAVRFMVAQAAGHQETPASPVRRHPAGRLRGGRIYPARRPGPADRGADRQCHRHALCQHQRVDPGELPGAAGRSAGQVRADGPAAGRRPAVRAARRVARRNLPDRCCRRRSPRRCARSR